MNQQDHQDLNTLFNDLVSNAQQHQESEKKTVGSSSQNKGSDPTPFNSFSVWDRMRKQAASPAEMEKMRTLHQLLTPAHQSVFASSSFFLFVYFITLGLLIFFTKNMLFSGNGDAVGVFFASVFFIPPIITFLINCIKNFLKKKILFFLYSEGLSDLSLKIDKLKFENNEIFLTNYICANLEIFDPELRKEAVTHILKYAQSSSVPLNNLRSLISYLPLEFNKVSSSPTIRALLYKSNQIEMNKLLNNDFNHTT